MILFKLILLGLIVGVISSFFGIGGGVIIVPTLYALFPNSSHQFVIGNSLAIITFTAGINIYNYIKHGKLYLNKKLILDLSIGMILGVLLGTFIASSLPRSVIKKIFGFILLTFSFKEIVFMVKVNKKTSKEISIKSWKQLINTFPTYRKVLIGLIAGCLSGVTGLGGGIILIPLFSAFLRMPQKLLAGHSNIIMFLGCFIGLIKYFLSSPTNKSLNLDILLPNIQIGLVNISVISVILIGPFISSKVGVYLNQRVPPQASKIMFTAMLLYFSGRIFLNS